MLPRSVCDCGHLCFLNDLLARATMLNRRGEFYVSFHFGHPRHHFLLSNIEPGCVLLGEELEGFDVVVRLRLRVISTAHAVDVVVGAAWSYCVSHSNRVYILWSCQREIDQQLTLIDHKPLIHICLVRRRTSISTIKTSSEALDGEFASDNFFHGRAQVKRAEGAMAPYPTELVDRKSSFVCDEVAGEWLLIRI